MALITALCRLSFTICYLLAPGWCQCASGAGAAEAGGLCPVFWGARCWALGPFPFAGVSVISHQMPSKEHMQLGWVVRWVLSAPPGHPAAGRCGRVACRASASASLAPLYSPCASPAFDRGSKPPSRSALAPVGSSPGPVLSPVTALQFQPVCS
jgi:hypothetical protein